MALRILWRRTRVFAGIALALALIALTGFLVAINWQPDTKAFPKQGIDVSEANGEINWWGVKETYGIQFAYARATVGAQQRDTRFGAYWRGLYEAGVPHGAIHIFSLCELAADQAGNFVSTVPRDHAQLPMAVDLDFQRDCTARPERDVVIGEIKRFLSGVEAHLGQPALLRVSKAFEARYQVSSAIQRPLWSVQAFLPASYFDKPWAMWQASGFRRLQGVSGGVNWDVMIK